MIYHLKENMDYQFINITTYRGISTNAEHFYANIGFPEYTQENLLVMIDKKPNTGVYYNDTSDNVKPLLYHPTYEEAKAMYLKDHYELRHKEFTDFDEKRIKMDVEDGTNRFPSILSIVEAAKKKFPKSILCFSISGSVDEFVKWIQRNSESEQVKKILEILL